MYTSCIVIISKQNNLPNQRVAIEPDTTVGFFSFTLSVAVSPEDDTLSDEFAHFNSGEEAKIWVPVSLWYYCLMAYRSRLCHWAC